MSVEKFGEEVGIQAADVLKGVSGRKLGGDSKVKSGGSKRKSEIKQHDILARLLSEDYGEVAGNRADAGAALGAGEDQ